MPISVFHSGDLTVVTPPGRILTQVGEDIAAGFAGTLAEKFVLYVGAHVLSPMEFEGRSVGVQTEQFFDETGEKLWNRLSVRRVGHMLSSFDHVLDLSPSNAPLYASASDELRAKLIFGPYIFPDHQPEFVPGAGNPIFFGTPTGRRKERLRELSRVSTIERVRRGTFGEELAALVRPASAVVNLHIGEGIYTEYPRMLSAYLSGKAVLSEPLAAPLEKGKHYADIETPFDPADAETHFRNFAEFAREFSISRLFEHPVIRAAAVPPGDGKTGGTAGSGD
ncbi:hypothetical protein [Paracoccus sediminicola]|uniref:hypothetical protein n=1 Tax=Paracoccus sediminicola TaxID=3017783 RepID=UPI0022F12A91|nr:hypothetical protein [Paracoccus sediminicola]WBU57946.1 hypothetical protein PAF18_05845 [Paracoccus sediminicola]